MEDVFTIREIDAKDAEEISRLSDQLGYTLDVELVKKQISSLSDRSDHYVFVATVNDVVVGYVHGFEAIRLTSTPFIEIGALIVNEQHRYLGIARKLVEHLENQIGDYEAVRVRCNVKRDLAHRFYFALNYQETKEQKGFPPGTIRNKRA